MYEARTGQGAGTEDDYTQYGGHFNGQNIVFPDTSSYQAWRASK